MRDTVLVCYMRGSIIQRNQGTYPSFKLIQCRTASAADPDPFSDFAVTESRTVCHKISYLSRYKSLFEDLFVNFSKFPCSWIRIRIQKSQINADPDPQHGPKLTSQYYKTWKHTTKIPIVVPIGNRILFSQTN